MKMKEREIVLQIIGGVIQLHKTRDGYISLSMLKTTYRNTQGL